MTTEQQSDRVVASFETLVPERRYASINGVLYELADPYDFSMYEHGRMERLRRSVMSALIGEDGSELTPERATIADADLSALMTILLPGAVGKTTMQKPRPTADEPDPEPVAVPVFEALTTAQKIAIVRLFTTPSASEAAVDLIAKMLRDLADPSISGTSPLGSMPVTESPPAPVTG